MWLCLLTAVPLRADELALELPRSAFCLVGQAVTVTVANRMSMVEGQYELKYVARLDQIPPVDTVAFEIPVFAPKDLDRLEDLAEITQIKLRVGNAAFDPADCEPLSDAGHTLGMVPGDTRVMVFTFRLPRAVLQKRFTLRVTYFQPHYRFGGQEVSAYLPLLPDFEDMKNELLFSRDDFTVDFEAVGSVRLRRLTTNDAVAAETPRVIKVHPVHREIIAVVVQAVAPAQTAAPPP